MYSEDQHGNLVQALTERVSSTIQDVLNLLADYRTNLATQLSQNSMQLTNLQRENTRFGWNVINNAIWEQEFWTRTRELRDYVTDMLTSLDYTMNGKTAAEREATLEKLLEYLRNVREKHLAAIQSLLMVEESSESPQKDRRDDLLKWNCGTRVYAREVLELAQAAQHLNLAPFEEELLELDDCLMLLWSPDDSPDMVDLKRETTTIHSAIDKFNNNRFNSCLGDINSLRTAPDRSMFAESVARVLRSHLPVNLLPEDNRLQELTEMKMFFENRAKDTRLQEMKNVNLTLLSRLTKWGEHFDKWATAAANGISKVI